jgi:hypothetical protein
MRVVTIVVAPTNVIDSASTIMTGLQREFCAVFRRSFLRFAQRILPTNVSTDLGTLALICEFLISATFPYLIKYLAAMYQSISAGSHAT